MKNDLTDIPWARRLKLRHLEMFLVLEEAGGITAASERLLMTQPAVSHWLSDLEEVVGCPLFIRGRKLQMTAAGKVLHGHAHRMLGDIRRTHEELSSVRSGLSGRIHIGSTLSSAPAMLPRAIARLQKMHPDVFVLLIESTFEVMLEKLGRREVDLVIRPLGVVTHKSGFSTEALIHDTVCVVARPGHPFARQVSPTWEEAANFSWIMPPAGTLIRGRIEESFAANQAVIPVPKIETSSVVMQQMLLQETDYLSVLSGALAEAYRALNIVEIVPLEPAIDYAAVGMVWADQPDNQMLACLIESLRLESRIKPSIE